MIDTLNNLDTFLQFVSDSSHHLNSPGRYQTHYVNFFDFTISVDANLTQF